MDRNVNQVVSRIERAADKERMKSPAAVQNSKAVRHSQVATGGYSPSLNASLVFSAKLSASAGAAKTIAANLLEADGGTGDAITVYFDIFGGSNPNCEDTQPYLTSGKTIFVAQRKVYGVAEPRWYCTTALQAFRDDCDCVQAT